MLGFHCKITAPLLVVLVAGVLAGCGGSDESSTPKVLTSNSQLLGLVQQIGGDAAQATSLAPPAINPHNWQPPSLAAEEVKSADIVLHAGGDLEPWFAGVARAAAGAAEPVDLSQSVDLIKRGGRANGHWITDLENAKRAAAKIAELLKTANPDAAETYEKNLRAFDADATRADELLQVCTSTVGDKRLRVVAGHDDLDYLARRYGIKVVAKLAAAGQDTPDAARDSATRRRAERGGARVVTVPWGQLDTQAALLAQQLKVTKISIFTDSLSDLTEAAKSLIGSIVYSVNGIVSSVTGGKQHC